MTDLFPPTNACQYRHCSPNQVAVSVNRTTTNIYVSHLIASSGPHVSIPSASINALTALPSCPPATHCMLCSCRRGGSRGSRGGPWGGPWARTRTRSRTRARTRTWAWAWAWRYVIWSGRGSLIVQAIVCSEAIAWERYVSPSSDPTVYSWAAAQRYTCLKPLEQMCSIQCDRTRKLQIYSLLRACCDCCVYPWEPTRIPHKVGPIRTWQDKTNSDLHTGSASV